MMNRYFRLIEIDEYEIVRTIEEFDTFEEAKKRLDNEVDKCISSFNMDIRSNVLKEYYRDSEYYSCTISYMREYPPHFKKKEYIVTVL